MLSINARKVVRRRSDDREGSTSTLLMPKDPRNDSAAVERVSSMALRAFQMKSPLLEQSGEIISSSVSNDSLMLAIVRGHGSMRRLPARMAVLLSREMNTIRSLISRAQARNLLIHIHHEVAPPMRGGSDKLQAQGSASALIAILLSDGRFSVARAGSGSSFLCQADGARELMPQRPFEDPDAGRIDLRQMDITDFALSRRRMEQGMGAYGLHTHRISHVEGRLSEGEFLVIGGGGFRRNLWICFEPMTEAVLDASGDADMSGLLASAPDPDLMARRLEAEMRIRLDLAGGMEEPVSKQGEWALAPSREDVSVAVLSREG